MTIDLQESAQKSREFRANGFKPPKFTFAPEARPLDGYTIKRAIHRGGFGEVYYALTDAGKEVAIKLLKNHLDVELRGISQCLNLKHPNLVTIFDVRQDAEGEHWVIMEYVSGKSLGQLLEAHPHGVPMDEARRWLGGLADGLSFLHDRGIVHRDIKPANIFLESGLVKIGDVGLSKFITESHRSAQTQSVGTVHYMAPEIAHGRYGREVDVYSLGIVLYEILTGRVPFDGESAGEILMKHLSERPNLGPLPGPLRPVLAHALEKDPLRRTPTARQLLVEFQQALGKTEPPQPIPPESFFETAVDSSTVNRERQRSVPDDFPEMIPEDVAYGMGLDASARFDLYRAHLEHWAARRSRLASPELKDRIAADVAGALRDAERTVRTAAESNAGQTAAERQFHSTERLHFKERHWKRHARRMRGHHRPFPAHRSDYAAWKAAADARRRNGWPPAGVPRPGSHSTQSTWWIKPLIIGLVIWFILRRPLGPQTFGIVLGWGICATLIYGVFKLTMFVYRRLFGLSRRASHDEWPTPHPAAAVGPQQRGKSARPRPLTPETARWVPPRRRLSELLSSLTVAALSTVAFVGGLTFLAGCFSDETQIGDFAGTLLAASWLILAQSKLWEGRRIEAGGRRLLFAASGAAAGLGAWWLNQWLMVSIPTPDSFTVDRPGPYDLIIAGTNGQPSLVGFVVFFAGLFASRRWWYDADAFRRKRLSIRSIVFSALLAAALAAIFHFPIGWGVLWAAALCAVVQLSAAWAAPRDRVALMQGVGHAPTV